MIIPSSVIKIDYLAFNNNKLTSIKIPDGVIQIGNAAFSDNQLTSIEIPNNLKKINRYTFSGNQLTSIVIPDSVTEIGEGAFNHNKLSDAQAFIYKRTDVDNDGIAEIDNTNIIGYGGKNTEVVIPNNVTIISDDAFSANQLTSIVISDSVTEIGAFAFNGNQLKNIIIGNGIKYIGEAAFKKNSFNNPDLSKITINKSCSDIKNIPRSNTDTNKSYPWLSSGSPYKASGVTIYGSNNEVCDSY